MEVCSLRDAATDFAKLGVTVYGISFDDVATQAAFAKKQKLDYQLLSDPDAGVGRKYGVVGGRGYANRVTFVLDPRGILRHIEKGVSVRTHGDDLARKIGELKKALEAAKK